MEGGFNQRGRANLEQWIEETIKTMQKAALMNDLILCAFTGEEAPMEFISDLVESATGEHFSEEELRACVDLGCMRRYAFNLRAGYQPSQNQLPKRILKQMVQADGRWAEDWPLVAAAYYKARGFNEEGYPTVETLEDAGLEDIVSI